MKYNTIYNDDCLHGLTNLDDDSVDLIVTSPPYNIGPGGNAFKFNGYDVYDDNNLNYDQFIHDVLAECYRVLKPSGSLMFNHKVRTVNKECIHPLHHIFNSRFTLKQEIVWDLHDTHIHNKDRFYPINEMIYWCVKDKRVTKFNGNYSSLSTIWRISRTNKSVEHCKWFPAPFPIEVPLRCIRALTEEDDVVLDPFMGAGTTALAAKMTNRRYIGFELSHQYCEMATTRIESYI